MLLIIICASASLETPVGAWVLVAAAPVLGIQAAWWFSKWATANKIKDEDFFYYLDYLGRSENARVGQEPYGSCLGLGLFLLAAVVALGAALVPEPGWRSALLGVCALLLSIAGPWLAFFWAAMSLGGEAAHKLGEYRKCFVALLVALAGGVRGPAGPADPPRPPRVLVDRPHRRHPHHPLHMFHALASGHKVP